MKRWLTWFALLSGALPMCSWATWSVVAVDPQTGEVGAAGATCWPDVAVIARLVPGKGAVVAQGLTSNEGRDHASKMLREGRPAQAIIDEITSKPVENSVVLGRSLRQYGIAALQPGGPTTASFTGFFTSVARGVREAPGVSVQGNMLASEEVLDRALDQYLKTPKACGLAIALLNALEAGAREGGDARCSAEQSALSAFLLVAKPNDAANAPTIRVLAPNQLAGQANPVMMLRERLRKRLTEQSMLPEGCSF
jgi:uncharacterized Ntn-hydrolase superfamily protein